MNKLIILTLEYLAVFCLDRSEGRISGVPPRNLITPDNRKPSFVNCDGSTHSLKEENVLGTIVTKVNAIDPDQYQTITYSLVVSPTDRTMFTIDRYSGRITTVHRFDRDKPIRDKIVFVTVRATDNGSPALDDVCTFKVTIEDINDNPPIFDKTRDDMWITKDTKVGSRVGLVTAYDLDDGDNSIIRFEILKRSKDRDYFRVNYTNGVITLAKPIDKSPGQSYELFVRAYNVVPIFSLVQDDAVHVSIHVLESNKMPSYFTKPQQRPILSLQFEKENYSTVNVAEDENINARVAVVTAQYMANASQITYSIVSGNGGTAFKIDEATGVISVHNKLDYEIITQYTLQVRAFDGTNDDNATIFIQVENVNDNPPKFAKMNYILEVEEEKVMQGCIETIEAWDPDIKSRNTAQHIRFAIVKVEQQSLLEIDDTGCLRQKVPLDRDPPNGRKAWQVIISATDQYGSGWQSTTTLDIMLNDTNDNAPFLTNSMPVVWYENQGPGSIVTLTAKDYDEPHNGPPFRYEISDSNLKQKFGIFKNVLYGLEKFDREEQKEYFIPIRIMDSGVSPSPNKISILHVVIGDVNDNKMRYGESKILVYNYEGQLPHALIGRVYVNDLDDWDLSDKRFRWKANKKNPDNFAVHRKTGMIRMLQDTRAGDYQLHFVVTEKSNFFLKHRVSAKVLVTVREISEKAINNSGSIRFYGTTAKEFVSKTPSLSSTPKDRLQIGIAEMFNISKDDVDVFTVLQHDNNASLLDVRFSAQGNPYTEPQKLNVVLGYHQQMLEEKLGQKIMMISADECSQEKVRCEVSCRNVLHKSNEPIAVYTNTSSFVGVNAFVRAECVCEAPSVVKECLNGGIPFNGKCKCHEGYEGPNCEAITVGFYGNGYVMYPPINPCNTTKIKLEVSPQRKDGLVMYIGPLAYNPLLPVHDFLALELVKGVPVLLLNCGPETIRIEQGKHRYLQGRPFTVEIVLQPETVEMIVCQLWACITLDASKGPSELLNAPLQLGGSAVNLESMGSMYNWTYIPHSEGFTGCLRNLTINDRAYDLASPIFKKNYDPGCRRSVVVAAEPTVYYSIFIGSILCIAVLVIMLLVVVVVRKSQACWRQKHVGDHISETHINYEQEGSGTPDGTIPPSNLYDNEQGTNPIVANDALISSTDDAYPFGGVRNFANLVGGSSLRPKPSVASSTDLKCHNKSCLALGLPKLADIQEEETSYEDDNVG